MVSMGFLFGTSRRTGVTSGLRRGVALFALGYTLDLVRFTAPALITPSALVDDVFGGAWQALLEIDILQLAGLSLMVLGVVKRLVPGPWAVVSLAFAVAAVAPLLWGTGGGTLLALFPHAHGPLVPGDHFHSGLSVQLLLTGFVFVWLPALWWLDRRLAWRLVPRYLTSLSRHITVVYVVQWALIGWLAIGAGLTGLPSRHPGGRSACSRGSRADAAGPRARRRTRTGCRGACGAPAAGPAFTSSRQAVPLTSPTRRGAPLRGTSPC